MDLEYFYLHVEPDKMKKARLYAGFKLFIKEKRHCISSDYFATKSTSAT
jgi:hypothetical protein